MRKLTTVAVTDLDVLQKCKDSINKWSSKLPFALTRKLGDDGQFVSATMYHAYAFRIATEFAHRKFVLKQEGRALENPTDIDDVNMWRINGAELTGDYDKPLPFTCHARKCDDCGGDGRVTCPRCNGSREEECSRCGGSGEEKCSECGGKGTVRCPSCGGGGLIGDLKSLSINVGGNKVGGMPQSMDHCTRCHGEGRVTCRKCGGTGGGTCKKCHGSRTQTCSKCDGSGEVKCTTCGGKGWLPHQYHLVQEQGDDFEECVWGDNGIPELKDFDDYEKYSSVELFHGQSANDTQVDDSEFPDVSAGFVRELKEKWAEVYQKYDGVADTYLHSQDVMLLQVDAAIRYEYKYKDKVYVVWVDLAGDKVFETEDSGLMAEWSKQIAAEGDKCAWKNPQKAIYQYGVSCAISSDNEAQASKMRKQLSWGSWLFRLASGGLGGWLWSVFMKSQGADPLMGWYIMGAMIFADILFAQKRFWMQLLAAGGVYVAVQYLLPFAYSSQIESDVYVQSYLVSCVLMFIGGTLLFARDLSLRIRGGVLVFPILGALVGGATAPGMYLDFAEKPELMVKIFTYVAYGICGLAVLRTWSRYWVQNCGWLTHKVPSGIARIETKWLKPCFWLIPIYLMVFVAIGQLWYKYAGPGVTTEMKVKVAERFLQDRGTRDKGKYYLEEAIKADYAPAIGLKAKLLILGKGKCGYKENPEEGYPLAVKASEMGDPLGLRMQGYCLENGKGVRQNLTEANVCYTKAAGLGDQESKLRKEATDEIAKVWNPAHNKDNEAQYQLAMCYAKGSGIAKDEGIARLWLLKAADAGHVKAQLLACDWLIKGIGGAADPKAGVRYCEKAAQQDEPEAVAALGYYYFDGKVIPRDYQKAVKSFEHACEKGSESAAYMLGHCYREGFGVETNAVKAFEYFKLADERRSLPGAFALGNAYEKGLGVGVDYTEALGAYARASAATWKDPLTGKMTKDAQAGCDRIGEIGKYWKAANVDNNAEAQDRVGLCFSRGTGVARDPKTAYAWYVKSAGQDYTLGVVHLADALYKGDGVAADKKAAARAFERGDEAGNVHSAYMLGVLHEEGQGVKRNLTTAHSYYMKAADKGYVGAIYAAKAVELPAKFWDDAFGKSNAEAQYRLGCCFLRGGCGVEKDVSQAFNLFKAAADQGHAGSLYMLSVCYRDGVGVAKNPDEQKKSIFGAAEKGHVTAYAAIGDMYRDGNLVEQDYTKALEYYNKAVDGGYNVAKASATQIDKVGRYWAPANAGEPKMQYYLGVCYRKGIQIPANEALAVFWLEKAAEQGYHDAEYELAEFLSLKKPSERANDERIVALLRKAVAADHVKAKTLLGVCLYTGRGIKEDYDKAVVLWEEAVNAGDLDAKCELAGYHFTGRGMFNSGKDRDKAIKEWTEAADAGHVKSACKLGQYYAGGTGLFSSGKDIQKGLKYLRSAATAWDKEAMVALAEVLADSKDAAEQLEGKKWQEKSKLEKPLNTIKYNVTVYETTVELASRLVTESLVKGVIAAKKAYNEEVIKGIKSFAKDNLNGKYDLWTRLDKAEEMATKRLSAISAAAKGKGMNPVSDKEYVQLSQKREKIIEARKELTEDVRRYCPFCTDLKEVAR